MFSYAILFLRFVMATSRRSRSTAKSLKPITAGGLDGTWDTKHHCISLDLPIGVTSIKMIVEGVDGVHTMDFSSFECSTSFVQWKDYDYPWSSLDFLLAREARQQGRHPPVASSHPYPRCQDIVRFENPTRLPFLHGGQWTMAQSAHTLLHSSIMHQTMSCCDLVVPSPTCPLPATGDGYLSWGLRWPGPGAAPNLTRAPTLLRALPLPSTLTPLPPAPHPLVFCSLPPAAHLSLWDVDPCLPPPFTASKVLVWRRKHFFMIFVMNSALWETCTPWLLHWASPIHRLTSS